MKKPLIAVKIKKNSVLDRVVRTLALTYLHIQRTRIPLKYFELFEVISYDAWSCLSFRNLYQLVYIKCLYEVLDIKWKSYISPTKTGFLFSSLFRNLYWYKVCLDKSVNQLFFTKINNCKTLGISMHVKYPKKGLKEKLIVYQKIQSVREWEKERTYHLL